jgi:DNA-binding FadR family transcriptional regulator
VGQAHRQTIDTGPARQGADPSRDNTNQVTQNTVRRLERLIQSGQLPAGSMLPSQRALAEQLNVGRSSLREALSILETLGVVQTKPRLGTFVREPSDNDPKPEWGLKGSYTPEEVYQFRLLIEGHAARLTATHATTGQRQDAGRCARGGFAWLHPAGFRIPSAHHVVQQ